MKTVEHTVETQDDWAESLDKLPPQNVIECATSGCLPPEVGRIRIRLGIRAWPDGKEHDLHARLSDSLLDVMGGGEGAIGISLLPPLPQEPLDSLRGRKRHEHGWSEPITELKTPLWLALVNGWSRHFAIEFRLAVKINSKWAVAPAPQMTPRELLTSFGFDPNEFSLYRSNSADLLAPDVPIAPKRGDCFEAQKDGRYGLGPEAPPSGLQTIENDVAVVVAAGVDAQLVLCNGQRYVEVRGMAIPSPPWSGAVVTILVVVPATYPQGGLDAFYLEQTINQGGSVPYQQSVTSINGRSWGLISWHYAEGRAWNPTRDDLASHITHCRGYFLKRGLR